MLRYRFTLSVTQGGQTSSQTAYPIYPQNLALSWELQSGERYYRAKLSSALTFVGPDYAAINAAALDARFEVSIERSQDGGGSWSPFFTGEFWKTDCEFDADAGSCSVNPAVLDNYTKLLEGIEKEFDLITLAPQIRPITLDRRPVIQVYTSGQSVLGCFLSGMYWEQECEEESSDQTLRQTYRFYRCATHWTALVSGPVSPELPDGFTGSTKGSLSASGWYTQSRTEERQQGDETVTYYIYEIVRASDNAVLWQRVSSVDFTTEAVLGPVPGSGATGDVTLTFSSVSIYARILCNLPEYDGQTTYDIPDNDIAGQNSNYSKVRGINISNELLFSTEKTDEPTQWGLYQPGTYYAYPSGYVAGALNPIARNGWGVSSVWLISDNDLTSIEQAGRSPIVIKDAYPLHSVLARLLEAIDPAIGHDTDCSQFLYEGNPITGIYSEPVIVPKSNVIKSGYDQPAQKALVTLREILTMLRDCYRCYWWIDDDGKLRVEHVKYFELGGSYTGTPEVGINLTTHYYSRSGKSWAEGQNQFTFDKPETVGRYQFGWMDDATLLFDGYPIDILSQYVNSGTVEEVSISQFSSDVDYILASPSEISKDGFVLLNPVYASGTYRLPYVSATVGDVTYILQNGYAAFWFLVRYYMWDLPAPSVRVNNVVTTASGVKKLRRQTVRFPYSGDVVLSKTIRTGLGVGTILRADINLCDNSVEISLNLPTS